MKICRDVPWRVSIFLYLCSLNPYIMKKSILLIVSLLLSMCSFAQLEVKSDSFKEVPGFVNINSDQNYQYDDNDLPFAVIKVRTENITDKQRRELKFSGNAGTFIMLEYKDGEVWVYLTAKYADYLKISHPDFSSLEFTFPFDLQPKKGYELTLMNKPAVDEDIVRRIEMLENTKTDNNMTAIEEDVLRRLEQLENQRDSVVFVYDTVKVVHTTVEKTQKVVIVDPIPDTVIVVRKEGVFSVSPRKEVVFSKGNTVLKSSGKWKFTDNQWDKGGLMTFDEMASLNDSVWFVLTSDEWKYLLTKRRTDSGELCAKATVNGIYGLVLLPDDWDKANFDLKNGIRITKDDWTNKLEVYGAVFLPAAGYRFNNWEKSVGTDGFYWSSDPEDTPYLKFNDMMLNTSINVFDHDYGLSVRMVKEL